VKRHYILFLAASLLASPGVAFANACQSGVSIATILSTNSGVCTIGNLTFDFTGYTPGGLDANGGNGNQNEYSSTAVDFTTISGGFELSGTFSSSSSSTVGYTLGDGTLSYMVSVSNGDLTGVATQVNGATFVDSPKKPVTFGTSDYAGGEVYSLNYVSTPLGGYAEDEPNSQQVWYGGSSTPSSANTTDSTSGSPFNAQPSSAGYAVIVSDAYNYAYKSGSSTYGKGGSSKASFTSADFTFTTVSAPEPSGWLSLLATGLLAIVSIRRLRRGRE